jgi:SAM-dependent methyltransferase
VNEADIVEMKRLEWYHKITLADGVVTPGKDFEHLWSPLKDRMRQVDFRGKHVLDVGCWDGLWSFEAEALGASRVLATDVSTQRSFGEPGPVTFDFARKHRGSRAEYREMSVYSLDSHREEFDIVIFFGVLYHLRYPQLGLARVRNALKDGGLVLLETAVLLDTDDTIIQTDHRNIYPSDPSTWNAFSSPALVAMMRESYFDVERCEVLLRQDEDRKIGRGFALGRATSGVNRHHYFPDLYLERFFQPYGAAAEGPRRTQTPERSPSRE